MRYMPKWTLFSLAFALASCVSLTVNIYFPTAEIKQAAEEIEQRVRTGQGAEGLQGRLDFAPARRYFSLAISLGGADAWAGEEVDIDIKSPGIIQIIESRTKRYKEIEPYMDKGILGETLNGYLALRDKAGLNLKELNAVKKLMDAENAERAALYKEILTANKVELNKENIAKVAQLFAEAIREKLKAGHWYMVKKEPKEEWAQKKKEEKK
ncbi:MAG: DUF1318 domain-containing protein [Candidatus Omnitrophica bacterium]|nr:DUF1318 domain-containing protein [Candidatus Omnitrophota bacterium]